MTSASEWLQVQLDQLETEIVAAEAQASRFDPLQQTSLRRTVEELQGRSDSLAVSADDIPHGEIDDDRLEDQVGRLLDLDDRLNRLSLQLQSDPDEERFLRQAQQDVAGGADSGPRRIRGAVSFSDTSGSEDEGHSPRRPVGQARTATSAMGLQVVSPIKGPETNPGLPAGHVAVAAYNYEAQQSDELGLRQGDVYVVVEAEHEGWCLVESAEGARGYVPESYLDVPGAADQSHALPQGLGGSRIQSMIGSPPRGAGAMSSFAAATDANWARAQQQARDRATVDALRAVGALPRGFRQSTLSDYEKEPAAKASLYLHPKLNSSGLAFQDLRLDSNGRPRATIVPVSRSCALVEAVDVPLLGDAEGATVVSRQLRVILCDNQRFLSNLVTLRAAWHADNPLVWRFDRKSSLPGARDDDGVLLVRSASRNANLNLVFELSLTVKVATQPSADTVSCGWAQLPLYRPDGSAASAKKYDLQLQGGNPFEMDVPLTAAAGARKVSRRGSRFIGGGGAAAPGPLPKLRVRLAQLRKAAAHICDTLPETVLIPLSSTPLVAVYRDIQVGSLLRRRDGAKRDFGPQNGICLRVFPLLLDRPELMTVLKGVWHDRLQSLRSKEKRDPQKVRDAFQNVIVGKLWPLMGLSLPPASWGDVEAETRRHEILLACLARCTGPAVPSLGRGNPAPLLLTPVTAEDFPLQEPLHTDEIAFHLLRSPSSA